MVPALVSAVPAVAWPYQFFTPLCPEHAPDLLGEVVKVPSLHSPVAPAGRLALVSAATLGLSTWVAGLSAVFTALSPLSAFALSALSSFASHFFTPPCDEQAPSRVAEVV